MEVIECCIAKQEHWETEWYQRWHQKMKVQGLPNRKTWEQSVIAQALHERGALREGATGIGFGVGLEPLPCLFAACGATVLATDQEPNAPKAREYWLTTGQMAKEKGDLWDKNILTETDFDERVAFMRCDMKNIPASFTNGYDFTWSAGSLEHLGSIEIGLNFIRESIRCLKPGGWAVHTTEFDLELQGRPVTSGDNVFYRRTDLEAFAERMRQEGHHVEPFDFTRGTGPKDNAIDRWPYHDPCHLVLEACGIITTSVVVIIRRAAI
jgi:SAM-dependent methyltransferase